MIRAVSFFVGLWVFLMLPAGARAEGSGSAPDFKEVYDLIRAHLQGISDNDLNRAAVQGLVSKLSPKVFLVNPAGSSSDETTKALVTKSSLLEEDIAYVRVGRVEGGLDKAVRQACAAMGKTNHLTGVVLDLRYAEGNDYAAAADTAALFLKKERPLMDWGKGMVQSKENAEALSWPVAVLVNHETAGAAEALAGVVRETGTGLVLGSPTAGQAMSATEYPIKNGAVLRIATAPIHLGDGSSISTDGLKPDIAVEVKPEAERAYYADAFQTAPTMPSSGTNALAVVGGTNGTNRIVRRSRFNEAELVRERKEGIGPDSDLAPERTPGRDEPPTVQDPALARALDVLKGLAVVRHSHS